MSDAIRVVGNVHSWGSIKLKLDGSLYHGFQSVSYGDKRERVALYGMGKHHAPRGFSRGKYTTEPGKIGGPKSSVQAFIAALAAKSSGGESYGNVEFEAIVQFIESDETPITVVLERCVVTGMTSSHDESADPLKDEFEFMYTAIRRNGTYLFDVSEGRP